MMRLPQIYLFVLAGLVLPWTLAAQAFPNQSGAAWRGVVFGLAGPVPFAEVMCGDTTISGLKYNKIYQINYGFNGEFYNSFYHGGTRTAGHKVWVIAGGATQETLLYDFGVAVGDTLVLDVVGDDWQVTYYIESVEQIIVNGTPRKMIRAQTSFGISDVWIEGIGSIMGPLGRGAFIIDAQAALTCFLKDGEVIYKTDNNQPCEDGLACDVVSGNHEPVAFTTAEIFPNPANAAVWVKSGNNEAFSVSIFSASGQLLAEQSFGGGQPAQLNTADLTPGFYFFRLAEKGRPGMYRYFKIAVSR